MKGVTITMIGFGLMLGMTSCKQPAADSSGGKNVPTRDGIAETYRWNLADIYTDTDSWESDFTAVEKSIPDLAKYKGKLSGDAEALFQLFKLKEKLASRIDKLYVYAFLNKDQDTRDNSYQAMADRIATLENDYSQAVSWIVPELQSIPEATLTKMINSSKELKVYQHYFDDLNRSRPHILNQKEEQLLAMAGNIARSADKIYEAITVADIQFPLVQDEDGSMVQLSPGRYYKMLLSVDAASRKRAFEGMYGTYKKLGNSTAATLDASIKGNMFYAQARHYNSSLEMALDADNIPVSVYENLIAATHENIEPLRRYMTLRKKALGLQDLHLYDTSVPFVKASEKEYPYDEAKELVQKSLAPMGEDYTAKANIALNSRWIDVYETQGKGNGAYSWGTFEAHPYILLNYNNSRDNMFTLAHELGHSLHSVYSKANQPYVYADYSLFVAEVASTFNENLLLDYMLKNTTDKEERLSLLDQWADNIVGTFYSQVLFAEFEKKIHDMAEAGVPLTAESMGDAYLTILKSFYGDALVLDEDYRYTWARISHFYRQFYVYKYATSIAASTYLYQKVADGDLAARDAYLSMLKSGGNDYPIELLKKAGVDMSTPEPVKYTLDKFNWIVSEMEKIIAES